MNQKSERHIILVKPEIPVNTGAIGRTVLGAHASLHLIKPLGFSLDSKYVKRAGLDYWKNVDIHIWDSFNDLINQYKISKNELFLFSRFSNTSFWNAKWTQRSFFVFFSETKGLPTNILESFSKRQFSIPTTDKIRSLNLATAAGIVLFESLRETSWQGCQQSNKKGEK